MRKRYAITMDEQVHRRLSLAAFEAGQSLGEYLASVADRPTTMVNLGPNATKAQVEQLKEALMEPPVRKAIEPDKVKAQPDGKLSKGLGPLPGQDEPTKIDAFHRFTPAPKPGKGKS